MADLIGGLISVPDATVSGVFPWLGDYPSVRAVGYDYVIHRIGLMKEQRILKRNVGNSWALTFENLYTSMSGGQESTLATLWTFYDTHRNPRTLFYFYDPREANEIVDISGASTTGRYSCRFKESELSFETFRDRLHRGTFEIIAVDTTKTVVNRAQYYPSQTLRIPTAAWMSQAAQPSMTASDSIIHFCSINRVWSTTGIETYPLKVSTHRYHHTCLFGASPTDTDGDYVPRLLAWDFQQELDQGDSGTIVLDDSDLAISQYLEQINITGWEAKFMIHLNGAFGDLGEPCQLWRGYVSEWIRDANEGTMTIRLDGAASRLRQMIPHRTAQLQCPLEFNDMPVVNQGLAECPYAAYGSGGDPAECDKSLDGTNGCVAHNMRNYFQGLVMKPSKALGLLPRAHWYSFGRDQYNSTSTPMKSVYGKVIPYVYGAGRQIVEAEIFEFRDESEFKVASGIVSEGPIGYANQGVYADAIGQVLLDNLPQHTGYEPVKAYGFTGQDVGTIIDPTFRCSKLAFVSIRTIDAVGFDEQSSGVDQHRILVEILHGLCGVRTYWWTGNLTLTRECYGGPIHYVYDIFLRALGLRGSAWTLVGGNDDQPRDQLIDVDNFLEVEAWQASQVASITDPEVTETLWDFRGVLRDAKPAIDWMRDLIACAPIDIVFSFGKLNFKARKDDITTPKATMMTFEQNQNIIDKSFSSGRFKPKFNSFTVTYADDTLDFTQTTVTIEDKLAQKRMGIYKISSGYNAFVPNIIKSEITLAGVFKRSQIIRLATQVLREELGGKEVAEQEAAREITFSAPLVGLGVEVGDVFRCIHEELPAGDGYFRCTGFRYTSDLAVEIHGKSVVASMYDSTPIMGGTVGSGDPVPGIPGGSQGSDGSINELPTLTAPVLTLAQETYRLLTIAVDARPLFANYLVVETSLDIGFSAPTEIIMAVPIQSFTVAGSAGVAQWVRAKWRRTTTPLEEGPWSNVITSDFPLIQQTEIEGATGSQVGAIVLGKSGIPTVATDVTFKVVMPFDGIFEAWHIKLRDAASGTTTVDANKNGVSIFSSNPSLSAGQTSADGTTGFADAGFLKGDIISLDFDAVGASPGIRLSLQLDFRTI